MWTRMTTRCALSRHMVTVLMRRMFQHIAPIVALGSDHGVCRKCCCLEDCSRFVQDEVLLYCAAMSVLSWTDAAACHHPALMTSTVS